MSSLQYSLRATGTIVMGASRSSSLLIRGMQSLSISKLGSDPFVEHQLLKLKLNLTQVFSSFQWSKDLGWLANVAKHLPKGLPSSQCLDPVDLSAGNLSVSAGRASGALEPLQNLASSAPDGFPVLRSGGSKRWKPLRAFVKPNWSTGRLGQAKLIYGKASSSKIDPRSILLDEGPERFPALRSTGSKHREPVRGTGS